MPDVVIDMEVGRMELRGDAVPIEEKVRKFPDVPLELMAQAKEMELEKQEFARQREKLGEDYYPTIFLQAKELSKELAVLWIGIREMQRVATVAHRAKERLKQTEAAMKAARRAGHEI